MAITNILIATYSATHSVAAPADSSRDAGSNAVLVTDANAGKEMPGVAAMVDDHIIPMEDVILTCLRLDR